MTPQRLPLILTFTLALVGASTAFADEANERSGPDFKPVGSFFTRYELRDNYADNTDYVRFRTRLGVEMSSLQLGNDTSLTLRVVPQASGLWHIGGDTTGDINLGLHEGMMQFHFGAHHELQAGRFEMSYGDELVIGAVGWNEAGRAFDAVRWRWRPQAGVGLDVFASLVDEGKDNGRSNNQIGGGDTWFFGAYGFLGGFLSGNTALEPYLLVRLAPRTTLPGGENEADVEIANAVEMTLGGRYKAAHEAMDWRVEGGLQAGTRPEARDTNVLAGQIDAEFGYRLGADRNWRLALNGLYASGDDPASDRNGAWFQLYPTAHKWLGFMDYIGGRSNVMGGGLLASVNIGSRWSAYLNTWEFHRPQGGGGEASRVGTEFDIGARFALGRGAGIRAGYGLFLPDADLSDEVFHFAELELRVDLP